MLVNFKRFCICKWFHQRLQEVWFDYIDETQTKLWNLMLKSCNTKVYVADGWGRFSGDNCLNDGDRILFEIVNNGEKTIWRFRVISNIETPIRKFQGKFLIL